MRIRIIGGERKGKRLRPIPGKHLRPTSDRLRETIFNIIPAIVPGAEALDIFAGTGALGIEALSRGAGFCAFIDNDPGSISLIGDNIRSCGFETRAKIIKWDVKKNLNCLKNASPPFDLAFLDPPYHQNLVNPALSNMAKSRCMAKHSIVIVEHSRNEPLSKNSPDFAIIDERRYGKTFLSFLRMLAPQLSGYPGNQEKKSTA